MTALDLKSRVNLAQTRILIVDDPRVGADVLGEVFRGYGAQPPVRVTSGELAAAAIKDEEFHLIICDGDLPDGQVYDFIAKLRRSDIEPNRFAPVIVLSAHTPQSYVAEARDCGANFVVAKPIVPLVLLERIVWVSKDRRPFIEVDSYVGPDRRFQHLGPPAGAPGRRKGDQDAVKAEASTPNMTQGEIDGLMAPAKVKL